jgi:hypothetical protein
MLSDGQRDIIREAERDQRIRHRTQADPSTPSFLMFARPSARPATSTRRKR